MYVPTALDFSSWSMQYFSPGRKSSATIPDFPLPPVVLSAQKVTIQQTRMLNYCWSDFLVLSDFQDGSGWKLTLRVEYGQSLAQRGQLYRWDIFN